MRRILLSLTVLWVVLGLLAEVRLCGEEDPSDGPRPWVTSPQICRGQPWSASAKAADWTFDKETRQCQAASGDEPLIASRNPIQGAKFVVTLTLRMQEDAKLRFFLDEIALILSDDGQTIATTGGPDDARFRAARRDDQALSVLRVHRADGVLRVELNGQEALQQADQGRAYEQIGLRPIRGVSQISRFSLTGQVVPRQPARRVPRE